MKPWLWQSRRMASAIGMPGWAGIALIVAAALLQIGPVRSVEHQIHGLQAAISHARHLPATPGIQAGREGQLAQFYDFFPVHQTLARQLSALHHVANSQGLSMGKVDYRLSDVSGTSLKRYEVAYSLVTDYPSLRVYLSTLLTALPHAALEDMEMQRSSDDISQLEARLKLVLYLRDDHGAD